MDASTRTAKPLFSLAVEYVTKNLDSFWKHNGETIIALPFTVKNEILRRFTISPVRQKVDFKKVLSDLVHERTDHVNLTKVDKDDEVFQILSKCKNLKTLLLSEFDGMDRMYKVDYGSSEALTNLFSNYHSLVKLQVIDCEYMTDNVLEFLAENCPNLADLNIEGCSLVTDLGIEKVSKLHLTHATFSFTEITDEGINHILRGPCKLKLIVFRIQNTNVSSDACKLLRQNCPNLKVLLYYSPRRGFYRCEKAYYDYKMCRLAPLLY